MKSPLFKDLDNYLQINPVKRRQDRAADDQYLLRLAADKHLREAQIMLEEYAVLRSERMTMIEGAKYFEQQDFLAKTDSIHTQLDSEHAKIFDDCLLTPIRQHASPLQRLMGIPGNNEVPAPPVQVSTCNSPRSRNLLHEAIAGIKDAKSAQWEKMNEFSHYWEESIVNLDLLKQL